METALDGVLRGLRGLVRRDLRQHRPEGPNGPDVLAGRVFRAGRDVLDDAHQGRLGGPHT